MRDLALKNASQGGFTLLEVMVSMAILAISMSAIVGVNVGAMAMASKTKGITVAAMLARSKMIDVEERIREKGFPDFDEKEDGDFDDDNFPNFKWSYEILKIKLPPPDLSKIDATKQQAQDMTGGSMQSDSLGIAPILGSNSMLMSGLPMVMDQIESAIREVRVNILWMEGKKEQNFSVTTHIVNIPGADVGIGTQQVVIPQGTSNLARDKVVNPKAK
jgi:general secretion pathway protein I